MSDTLFGFLVWWTLCCTVVVWYAGAVPVIRKLFKGEEEVEFRFRMWILSPCILLIIAISEGGLALANWLFSEDQVARVPKAKPKYRIDPVANSEYVTIKRWRHRFWLLGKPGYCAIYHPETEDTFLGSRVEAERLVHVWEERDRKRNLRRTC